MRTEDGAKWSFTSHSMLHLGLSNGQCFVLGKEKPRAWVSQLSLMPEKREPLLVLKIPIWKYRSLCERITENVHMVQWSTYEIGSGALSDQHYFLISANDIIL